MGLDHEKGAGDDEAATADDLRYPVDSIEKTLRHVVVDTWQRSETADPEDGGAEHLERTGQKAEFVDIVRLEIVHRRQPLPALFGARAALFRTRGRCPVRVRLSYKIFFVPMVMRAARLVRPYSQLRTLLSAAEMFLVHLLDRPSKAAFSVLIDGFQHE